MSNTLPKPDRSRPHSGSYTFADPDQVCPLLLGLAQSCSLRFGFPVQQCAQPPNSWCAVVKISPTSELSLFRPNQRGEPVITQLLSVTLLELTLLCNYIAPVSMDFCQNGSDELFHLSPFIGLHEKMIAPKYRPFSIDQVLSSGSLQHPNGMQEGKSGPHAGHIQSEASGDTVITEPYTYWNSTY